MNKIMKLLVLCFVVAAGSLQAAASHAATLKSVRMHEAPDSTRVVFDTSAEVKYKIFTLEDPFRVVVDLQNTAPRSGFDPAVVAVGRDRVDSLRAAPRDGNYRVVIDTKTPLDPKAFTLNPIDPYGHRLVVDLFDPNHTAPQVAQPPSKNRDVVIAIDAGHGGDDPGAIGPRKILEKRVVLQIAQRVRAKLNALEGFQPVLIRTGDYYLAHRERTQLARNKRADLFISIHADAFRQADVKGASVYTLSALRATQRFRWWRRDRTTCTRRRL